MFRDELKKTTFEAAYENPTIASRDDFKDWERDFPQASWKCYHCQLVPIPSCAMTIQSENKIIPVSSRIAVFSRRTKPFPSSPQSLFESDSKCEIFIVVISSNFNMNEN